ncbi:enoyl-CoA hydratase/isomerase family protein [Cytobacillus sp. Hm23]
MEKLIINKDENGIVWATINRLGKRNAIDYDVMNKLEALINDVRETVNMKAMVITGAGNKAFCSGGDLSVFHQLKTKREAYEMLSKMGEILYSLQTLPKPTVALLNGFAIGGGCELATACDFRLAKQGSKLGFIQSKLAITTGWGGATLLNEKIPYDKALELLMTAKMISAEKAYEIGFVNKVFNNQDLLKQCIEYLKPLLETDVHVLSSYKQVLINKWKAHHLKERMFAEIEQCASLWARDEHHHAVEAFLNSK